MKYNPSSTQEVSLTIGFDFAVLAGNAGTLALHCLQLILCLLVLGFSLCLGMMPVIQPGLESGQLLLNPEHVNTYVLYVVVICLLC